MGNGMRVLERGFCPKFVQASLSRVHRVAPVGSTLSVPAGMSAHFTPMRAKALAGSFSEWHWGRGELAASSLDRCQPESLLLPGGFGFPSFPVSLKTSKSGW